MALNQHELKTTFGVNIFEFQDKPFNTFVILLTEIMKWMCHCIVAEKLIRAKCTW